MSPGDEDVLGRAYDHRLMRRLMGYLRPYRAQVAFAVAVVVLDAVAQLAGPWLTMKAIDNGIRHRDLIYLDRVAALYFGVLLVAFGLGYLQTQIMQRVGQQVMMDLRMALFRHLQRLPVSYFDRNPVGRLLTRVTHDVDVINELFTAGVVAIFGDLLTLLAMRMLPGFPHSVINFASGVLRLPMKTFVAATIVGLTIKWGVYATAMYGITDAIEGEDVITIGTVLPLIPSLMKRILRSG